MPTQSCAQLWQGRENNKWSSRRKRSMTFGNWLNSHTNQRSKRTCPRLNQRLRVLPELRRQLEAGKLDQVRFPIERVAEELDQVRSQSMA